MRRNRQVIARALVAPKACARSPVTAEDRRRPEARLRRRSADPTFALLALRRWDHLSIFHSKRLHRRYPAAGPGRPTGFASVVGLVPGSDASSRKMARSRGRTVLQR